MISVDKTRCIGCPACSKACPKGLIAFQDDGKTRVLRFAACRDDYDCDICLKVCPEKAISLAKNGGEIKIDFILSLCSICGNSVATELMIDKIKRLVPLQMQRDSYGRSWLEICPACRRAREAENATGRILAGRSQPSSIKR